MTIQKVIDCDMTFDQALAGKKIPAKTIEKLALIDIEYWSFDHQLHRGQLLINKSVASEVKDIFAEIKAVYFPLQKMIPISKYAWSDKDSMADNNSSAFNYRPMQGERILSKHASGLAIDINPRLNPYVKDTMILPSAASYLPNIPGTITTDSIVVRAFTKRGWKWGGAWRTLKDWQHFEK